MADTNPSISAGLAGIGGAVVAGMVAFAAMLGIATPTSVEAADRIGQTSFVPRPACPQNTRANPCEVIGSVTGFQRAAQGRWGLMRAREDGHLVAWAIRLSRPTRPQQRFFGEFFEAPRFGTRPHARIAVLRHRGGQRYRLVRQSPPVNLTRAFGGRQIYTLAEPLRVRAGDILGLTIPSWAPAFAVGLPPRRNVWRSSRQSEQCDNASDIQEGQPHQRPGTTRVYGCTYRTARLLYWGYYVPDD